MSANHDSGNLLDHVIHNDLDDHQLVNDDADDHLMFVLAKIPVD